MEFVKLPKLVILFVLALAIILAKSAINQLLIFVNKIHVEMEELALWLKPILDVNALKIFKDFFVKVKWNVS